MRLAPHSRLLFIGDSITDSGRERKSHASPWEDPGGLGFGYVEFVNAMLQSRWPERKIRVLNRGLGGNTIRDLAGRWKRDVLDLRPDWLSIKIGINDVWRQFDSPRSPHVHVLPEEFQATYRQLLEATRDRLKGLIIISPYHIESDRHDPMRRRMDEYRKMTQTIASEFDAIYVDSQLEMDRLMEHIAPQLIAEDKIHPNSIGHMALAQAVCCALES
ncbi:SGNH/GDSL hydrolase family protein [Pelagicoccus albus]|uniref:SGNH/GDSL hydrolase family protein n=1 Tax=Pelagicoccus albus TaxID=415222 RepID=A0A7X1B5P7_9BACT|nr:SGNH/GDSL hydrolase family protein [Pelagicoccus albus]MBC2606136.1 SGNH/GDSL hydrolase family protein [Pelagicoccus albus]